MSSKRNISESGESSKNAEKRAKKQNTAAIAASMEERSNSRVRISDEGSNSPNTEEDPNDSQEPPKKTRGPSKLRVNDKGKEHRVDVEFNERSQPIGEHSIKLSSYLGSLVRENIPVTAEMSKLPEKKKNALWELVQQNFNLDDSHKKSIFQRMGKHLRDHKSVLTRSIREMAAKGDVNDLSKAQPDDVTDDQWKEFLEQRLSPEFLARSKIFQEMRKCQKLPHTTSRKGYARLEDDMRKASDAPDELNRVDVWVRGHLKGGKHPINEAVAEVMEKMKEYPRQPAGNVRNDALTHVLGPDPRGQVRGLGYGTSISKIEGQVRQNSTIRSLQTGLLNVNREMDEMKKLVSQLLMRDEGRSGGDGERIHTPVRSSFIRHEVRSGSDEERTHTTVRTASTQQSASMGVQNGEILENTKCKLLHWVGTDTVVVAESRIASTDPKSNVHHMPLGVGFFKVWVDRVMHNVTLFRPTSDMSCLNEAKGSTTAWPTQFIQFDG